MKFKGIFWDYKQTKKIFFWLTHLSSEKRTETRRAEKK
jgi:hypothetical protein